MIAFPNAKINLGLKVLEKRPDGFHNIETIFYPIELCDVLEIIPAKDNSLSFASTGLPVPGNPEENLCLKAFHLLTSTFYLPPVKIHLHKVIPAGAGLGGGSSDGAFTIKLLNDIFFLGLTDDRMMDYARSLGSDCAFFIPGKPAFAFEKGDRFEFLDLELSKYRIEVITPGIHINTGAAYSLIDLRENIRTHDFPLKEVLHKPIPEWKKDLINDFEKPVFTKYPELAEIKKDFYDRGALYASMSGSGSSIYGIFNP